LTHRAESWREGLGLLSARLAASPGLVHATLRALAPVLGWQTSRVRRVVATGVGASAVHARLLVTLLGDAGLAARFLPTSSFIAAPPADAGVDALVVFSQGLSPNARLALAHAERWAAVTLVTAVPDPRDAAGGSLVGAEAGSPPSGALEARQEMLARLVARGVHVARVPAAEEYGTLLRVAGPLVGIAAAIVLARAIARAAGHEPAGLLPHDDAVSAEQVRTRLEWLCADAAHDPPTLDAHTSEPPTRDARTLADGCAFVSSGAYAELLGNVQATVQEGLLVPAPPVWDLLGFAHGPFQQIVARDTTLLALTRGDAAGETELLERLESMLVPRRHRLIRLPATLPGAFALLEHQAIVSALVLRAIAERGIDQIDFPGHGADAALYGVDAPASDDALAVDDSQAASTRGDRLRGHGAAKQDLLLHERAPQRSLGARLADLTWPDVDALRAAGCTTAILPLGSTEQHGLHLPFATDTLIADAVAVRVAARLGGALCLPALPLGCAEEHLAFPGTLSLATDTLAAIVRDTGRALARHGFARLLVFTAHGGNYDALRVAGPGLTRDLLPLRLDAFLDFACLTRRLEEVARAHGVTAGEAGQHAGELEASILLALAPGLVRRERMTAGLIDPPLPPDELFYPDLRRHASDGTVGDPRGATATRAAAYLDAWADVLATSWSAPAAK
jgi:creatinine amidohydrolase/Fe(II)-dependent formamide hydrolase-like protein